MANDIICEISSENELICEMSSAGEIVVEITGMTYQSVAAELAGKASVEDVELKADKAYVDSQDALKADKTYVDSQDALKADKADTYTKTEVDAKDAGFVAELAAKANKLQSAAIAPTIIGGAIQSATSPLTYAVDDFGYANFQGAVVPSTATSFTLMRLPVGYRPAQNLEFLGPSGTVAAFRILVRADGYVTIYNHATQASYFDVVHFKVV